MAWGEADPAAQEGRTKFLYTGNEPGRAATHLRQATIHPLTGIEWVSRNLVDILVKRAAEIGEWMKEASTWEAWTPEEQVKGRSRKEEIWLWKQLDMRDSRQAKLEKWENIKKSRKVAKARSKMKVGKKQPSIMDKLGRSKQLEGSRLDTTLAVPAPSSSRTCPVVSVAQLNPQQGPPEMVVAHPSKK